MAGAIDAAEAEKGDKSILRCKASNQHAIPGSRGEMAGSGTKEPRFLIRGTGRECGIEKATAHSRFDR